MFGCKIIGWVLIIRLHKRTKWRINGAATTQQWSDEWFGLGARIGPEIVEIGSKICVHLFRETRVPEYIGK